MYDLSFVKLIYLSCFIYIVLLLIIFSFDDIYSNMCEPGDVYNWAFCNTPICDCCFSWCKNKCAGLNRSMTAQKCKRSENPNHTDCDCCCDKNMSPPSPPPPSPPPPSPPPPSPSPPPPANMCEPGDVYKSVVWGPTQDCTICTSWCKDQCTNMSSLVVAQTCGRTPPGSMNFRCDCCCKNMPPPPPSKSPPPPSPSPPPPSPPPPPPSPPPPSPPPPSISPPPPPTPPINICRAGEDFIPNPVTDCSVCTSDYCRSQCSARGASLARMGCAPSLLSCKCCCKSLTLPSSTTALGSSLFAAIPEIMFH
ncbi:hypothetical protein MKX03_026137 [Papaver bracteatum]|nr:hypothetical protein MKX03_026137 [Papaver bracteatum]